ncbi:feruloyl esterase B [Diplocarpon mali]|nr:feruloyl esterase B [Diplocarpon mali]
MVALHFCTGTGPGYFRNSRYADLADTKGFDSHLPDGPFCQHLFEFQEARSPQIQNLPLLPTRVPPGAMTVRTGSQRSLLKLGGGYGKELRPWSQRHANQDVDVSSPGQNTAPTGGTNRRHSRHGTSDVLFPLAHLADTLGQWSSLLGVSLAQNIPDSPQANYTKIVYGKGTELVGYETRGVAHTLPLFANVELELFGIV